MKYLPLVVAIGFGVLLVRRLQHLSDMNNRPLTPWRQEAWKGMKPAYRYTQIDEAERRRMALAAEHQEIAS